MINHIRSLILNISAEEQPEVEQAEVIEDNFVPLVFSSGMKEIHRIFFKDATSLEDRVFIAFHLVKVINSTELQSYLIDVDDISLVDLDSSNYFGTGFEFDLVKLDAELQNTPGAKSSMELLGRKLLDKDVVRTLSYVSVGHFSPVYRVAAIVTLFVLIADQMYLNRASSVAV